MAPRNAVSDICLKFQRTRESKALRGLEADAGREATPVFMGGGGMRRLRGRRSHEKSLLDLGLCTCLYLCGAESKNFSGTKLL